MTFVVPYLRVLAGFVAGMSAWLAVPALVGGDLGQALAFVAFAVGFGWLAVGRPLRDRRARRAAERAAIAARADAGHAAFLAGDPAAYALPPMPPPKPPVRKGVVVASVVAAVLLAVGIVTDLEDGLAAPNTPAPTGER